MTDPTIRDQRADDAAAVSVVVAAAFATQSEVVALEADLDARSDSRGFVAVDGRDVVGHVRLTRGWIDAAERLVEVLVLSPLSVLPARQGFGIGSALVAHAVRAAERSGAPAVFLEGDPRYYGRLGWRPAAEIGVVPPSARIPGAAFQAFVLPACEGWMRGVLVYPETFWRHDAVGLRGAVLAEVEAALGVDDDAGVPDVVVRERALLDPQVRADSALVAELLTADFVEFGSSGRIWDRDAIISAMARDPGTPRQVADAHVVRLGPDAALLTYRLVGEPGSIRSSLWVRGVDRQWRLRFHQGTPRAADVAAGSTDLGPA